MRIAITSRGPTPRAEIDRCFARSYWFLIYDLQSKEWTAIDNYEIRGLLNNAGELACQLLKEQGVDVLITGETGPKAYSVLKASGIEVYHNAIGCAEDMLLAWSLQKLRPATKAKARGSSSCLAEQQPEPSASQPPRLELSVTRQNDRFRS